MKPLLLAGHGALELLDTQFLVHGEPVELIGDGGALVEWMNEAGLIESPRASTWLRRFGAELDEVAAEARQMRAWAITWLARWHVDPNEAYEAELRRLNGYLACGRSHRHIRREDDGRLSVIEHASGEDPRELLAILAEQLAALVAHEDPSLVKRCEGTSCVLWFLDRTKAHRRRFCSPAACGNREKVAAFRQRQRESS